MKIMKDTTAMAYELREFFACQVARSKLKHMDNALFAGEPHCAMMDGFALAYDLRLYVPQAIRDEYLTGVKWNEQELEELNEYFEVIPLERAA